ncbi:MAG: hypothetical protein ACRDS1_17010 [Pseudonocardiaceae bacterium]
MDHEVIPLLGHLGPDVNRLHDSVSQLSHMASRLPKASGGATTQAADREGVMLVAPPAQWFIERGNALGRPHSKTSLV